MGMTISRMTERDVPFVHEIRNYYILNSITTVSCRERSPADSDAWITAILQSYPAFTAWEKNTPVGYALLGPFRSADGYVVTAEVTVYVHPNHLRKKAGGLLLRALIDAAPEYGLHCLVSAIVCGNVASERLHLSCGFERVGVLPECTAKNGAFHDILFMYKLL